MNPRQFRLGLRNNGAYGSSDEHVGWLARHVKDDGVSKRRK